ncbi:MAG: cytochrome P450 [Nocardioides sp.]|nr:cytochrome P450 [Nocardioides sp.]
MRNDWDGQRLPHPPRIPLVGDFHGVDRRRPLQSFLRDARTLGPLSSRKIFGQQFVFATTVELAAELCDEKRFEKGFTPAVVALRDYAGDGLFTAYRHEPAWQLAHDLLMPAFTRPAMERYHQVFVQATHELLDSWDQADGPVDVAAGMTKLTMESISRAAFSRDFGSFTTDEPHPFVAAMVAALRGGQRQGVLEAMPGGQRAIRRLKARNAHHLAYVEELLDEVISTRRRDGGDQQDLLGIMLEQAHPETGERLSDTAIRYQMLTFLVAGHETTSGALSFALHYLTRDPAALARAQAETDEVLGPDPDAVPTFEQVPKFRYLRRCLDEGLRLWPTVPGFARTPREPTTLSTGHRMRPGDWALVLLPLVHRDPEVWGEDADVFDPDRFLPERSRGRPAHSYKPFGTGERACIGRQFALHEALLVLAMLLHRYDLRPDSSYELQIEERLTLMPEHLRVDLTPRVPTSPTGSPERIL